MAPTSYTWGEQTIAFVKQAYPNRRPEVQAAIALAYDRFAEKHDRNPSDLIDMKPRTIRDDASKLFHEHPISARTNEDNLSDAILQIVEDAGRTLEQVIGPREVIGYGPVRTAIMSFLDATEAAATTQAPASQNAVRPPSPYLPVAATLPGDPTHRLHEQAAPVNTPDRALDIHWEPFRTLQQRQISVATFLDWLLVEECKPEDNDLDIPAHVQAHLEAARCSALAAARSEGIDVDAMLDMNDVAEQERVKRAVFGEPELGDDLLEVEADEFPAEVTEVEEVEKEATELATEQAVLPAKELEVVSTEEAAKETAETAEAAAKETKHVPAPTFQFSNFSRNTAGKPYVFSGGSKDAAQTPLEVVSASEEGAGKLFEIGEDSNEAAEKTLEFGNGNTSQGTAEQLSASDSASKDAAEKPFDSGSTSKEASEEPVHVRKPSPPMNKARPMPSQGGRPAQRTEDDRSFRFPQGNPFAMSEDDQDTPFRSMPAGQSNIFSQSSAADPGNTDLAFGSMPTSFTAGSIPVQAAAPKPRPVKPMKMARGRFGQRNGQTAGVGGSMADQTTAGVGGVPQDQTTPGQTDAGKQSAPMDALDEMLAESQAKYQQHYEQQTQQQYPPPRQPQIQLQYQPQTYQPYWQQNWQSVERIWEDPARYRSQQRQRQFAAQDPWEKLFYAEVWAARVEKSCRTNAFGLVSVNGANELWYPYFQRIERIYEVEDRSITYLVSVSPPVEDDISSSVDGEEDESMALSEDDVTDEGEDADGFESFEPLAPFEPLNLPEFENLEVWSEEFTTSIFGTVSGTAPQLPELVFDDDGFGDFLGDGVEHKEGAGEGEAGVETPLLDYFEHHTLSELLAVEPFASPVSTPRSTPASNSFVSNLPSLPLGLGLGTITTLDTPPTTSVPGDVRVPNSPPAPVVPRLTLGAITVVDIPPTVPTIAEAQGPQETPTPSLPTVQMVLSAVNTLDTPPTEPPALTPPTTATAPTAEDAASGVNLPPRYRLNLTRPLVPENDPTGEGDFAQTLPCFP